MSDLLGRKVKIISNKYQDRLEIGSIGIIICECEEDKDFLVDVNGETGWHKLDSVELLEEIGDK